MPQDALGGWTQAVDLSRLSAWMDAQGLGGGEPHGITLLGGGTQNILLRFSRGDRQFVLRRPSLHPRPQADETMRREARILAALRGSQVPHPGLIAACMDASVIGAAFYLMEPVEGLNASLGVSGLHAEPAVQHRMGLAAVEAIVKLGQLDYLQLGLADFGRVDAYLQRQVTRWATQLKGYAEMSGWPGAAALPDLERIAAWLARHCPAEFQPGIIHGDYHLANVMFRHDSGELAAVIDWELTTIGDPLIDLAWLAATWSRGHGDTPVVAVEPWLGFPKISELFAHYAERSGRRLDRMDWYFVLACYKLGILLEGTYARACAGLAETETGEALHRCTLHLLGRAAGVIDTGNFD